MREGDSEWKKEWSTDRGENREGRREEEKDVNRV